jgi:hypothetical protein
MSSRGTKLWRVRRHRYDAEQGYPNQSSLHLKASFFGCHQGKHADYIRAFLPCASSGKAR